MNLQQYKYRRNFPYNNTIYEESAEHCSENKSALTFRSKRIGKLFHEVSDKRRPIVRSSIDKHIDKKIIMKSEEFGSSFKNFFKLKSETENKEIKYNSEDETIEIKNYEKEYILDFSKKQTKINKEISNEVIYIFFKVNLNE